MDLRLLHPRHPLRLGAEISRVRKIAERTHQVMRLVWWGVAIDAAIRGVISAVYTGLLSWGLEMLQCQHRGFCNLSLSDGECGQM